MGKRLAAGIAGSRLAVIVTTSIITTIVIAGGIAAATVAINSVGSAEIIDGSIRSADISDGTVRGADIANGSVSGADIANGTVRSADLVDGTVRSSDIADGTVRSADIAQGTVTRGDLAAGAKPAGVNFADGDQNFALTGTNQSVRAVVLDAPAAGHVIVTASGYAAFGSAGFDQVYCSITDGGTGIVFARLITADDLGIIASTQSIPLSGTRTFAVPAGPTTFRLVCREQSGTVVFFDSQITALYVPTLYAP